MRRDRFFPVYVAFQSLNLFAVPTLCCLWRPSVLYQDRSCPPFRSFYDLAFRCPGGCGRTQPMPNTAALRSASLSRPRSEMHDLLLRLRALRAPISWL